MVAKELQKLDRSIDRLRGSLLPREFSPTAHYRNHRQVYVRTSAFIVLSHAEVESFLEERASELLELAWTLWSEHAFASRTIVCLLAYHHACGPAPSASIAHRQSHQTPDLEIAVSTARDAWLNVRKNNHGVKEQNVRALFLPLGVSPGDLDTVLMSDLDSLGKARGDLAHRTTHAVRQFLDPEDEYHRMKQLVTDLSSLDSAVGSLAQALRAEHRRLRRAVT